MSALLAILVAMALLVAPIAGAWAANCPAHDDTGAITQSQSRHLGVAPAHRLLDHKACCAGVCCGGIVMLETATIAFVYPRAAVQHHLTVPPAISGLVFPPTLGPPRPLA